MLTESKVKTIHADITAALKEVAKKHGLTLSPSRISYTTSTFKLTAEFGDAAETGGIDPKLLNNTKRHGWKFGLSESDIGNTFKHGAKTFKFLGLTSPQKSAVDTPTGEKYQMRTEDVAASLGKSGPSMVRF
jgi:hypothetical protein